MPNRISVAPTEVDDITILPDPPPAILDDTPSVAVLDRRRHLRWLLPVVPWIWFVIRGFHPWFEPVAILLPALAAASIVATTLLAAFYRSTLFALLSISTAVFLLAAIALPRSPVSSDAPTTSSSFVSLNVAQQWFSYNDVDWFVQQENPDVFFGIELPEPHDRILRERFTHAISDLTGFPADPVPVGTRPTLEGTYRENDGPGIGLYSQYPLRLLEDPIADQVAGGLPGFRAIVELPDGDVVLYALHVPRPGNGSDIYQASVSLQHQIVHSTAEAISNEELPVIVMGDLNLVDRGALYGRLTEDLADVMRSDGWAAPTRAGDFWHTFLQLRIDHLLISPELCAMDAQADTVFFSDHRPVQANIGPCPQDGNS